MARQKGTWAEENDGCPRFAVLYCEIGHGSGDSRRFTGEFLELLANSGVSWRVGARFAGETEKQGEKPIPFAPGKRARKNFSKQRILVLHSLDMEKDLVYYD